MLIWACTVLVALAALVAGVVLFGSHAVAGAHAARARSGLPARTGAPPRARARRDGYVAFGFTALLAIGTLFSTLTDTATGAVGATIGVYIVSEILDSISQLGAIRYGFPTHYMSAWQSMFTENPYSHDMVVGIVVQLAYLAVFGTAALLWFRRRTSAPDRTALLLSAPAS